jgi:hypothetical protein
LSAELQVYYRVSKGGSVSSRTDPADWLLTELQDAREFLGIADSWSIHAKQVDKPGGNDDADGWCEPNYT